MLLQRILNNSCFIIVWFQSDTNRTKLKSTSGITRSDSVGSGSGRKFLTPTLSDPSDKEKNRKASYRNLKPLNMSNLNVSTSSREQRSSTPKVINAVKEIHEWWLDQLDHYSDISSSDDDNY